jgi:LmbE family N-acetylglucosaminyl deacetylase
LLGCKEELFLDFPDGEIAHYADDVYEKLQDILMVNKPDLVFSPSPIDYHDDHKATSEIALKLLSNLKFFKLAFYEVYSTLKFTHLIEITEVIEQKKEIISNYHTSLYGKPDLYVKASLGLNAHRSIFTQKEGYYEAFYILEKAENIEFILKDICYRRK